MADITTEIRDMVIRHVEAIRTGIVQNMQSYGRTVSGASVRSLVVIPDANRLGASLYGAPQWRIMQRGKRPSKVPHNFREIIKQWIMQKGISFKANNPNRSAEQQLNSFAYIVARSIEKNGTKLYRDGGYNDIYDTLAEKEAQKLADEAGEWLSVYLDKVISGKEEQ